jgi:hypothetical protein
MGVSLKHVFTVQEKTKTEWRLSELHAISRDVRDYLNDPINVQTSTWFITDNKA